MTDEQYDTMAVENYRLLLLSKKLYDYAAENDLLTSTEGSTHYKYECYIQSEKNKYKIVIK